MSKTIDQRVVEMQFDNSHFEKNVATSMSTLEKLKKSLNLTGASKGLENINSAASKVDMKGLSSGVETVSARFSALQVAGVTALANITNSAVNAGKRIVSALTIDPVKTGFNEYETKINAIQTIMSNTASKGTTMEDVTRVIDELNTYADKTIYNFAEMTRNIGTFTAAGVGLEESAAAIQGIANLAAASGSNSQQASTAMYQLSQALAAGTVKLMDWNSVVNAGMGGEKFQEALKATAREMGISVDSIIEKNGSFRDSLQDGWITAEVLNTTLKKFTKEGAKEYADAMVASGKYTQEQADALLKEAQSMEDAATKVKTFTQLMDTLKESVQSGWSKTWEILIGDFDEAKELFTSLSDFLGGFINKMSDFRNNILEGALGSPFGKLAEKIESVTGATKTMVDTVKNYGEVVDRVISGEFGNGQTRFDKLTEQGYNWAKVQNMVNEKLGDSTRHSEALGKEQENLNKTQATTIEQLVKMSDAQLKSIGFTEDEIKAFRELEEQSKKTGIPIKDLVKDMDQLSGRSLLINSFKNAWKGLEAVFKSIKDAWTDVFPPKSVEERSKQLYNIIAAIHKFSTHLTMSGDTADKLTRTFKGLFAILDIISTITGGAFKIGIQIIQELARALGYVDVDILSLTANVGDAIVAFRDWIDKNNIITKGIKIIVPFLVKMGKAFVNLVKSVYELPAVQKAIDAIADAMSKLEDVDLLEVGKNIIEGLIKGLGDGAEDVIKSIIELGKKLVDGICKVLGIHSPSREFIKIGKNIIDGLIQGIQNGFSAVGEVMQKLASKCIEFINNIDWGTLFAIGISAGALYLIKKIADAFELLAGPLEAIADAMGHVDDVVKGFVKLEKAFTMKIRAQALKEMATGIAILAASVAVLSFIDPKKLWNSVAVVAALAGVLVALSFAAEKISDASVSIGKDGVKTSGLKSGLIAIGGSLLLLAFVVKTLGNLDTEQAKQGFLGLAGLVVAIGIVFAAYGTLVKGKAAMNISKAGSMLLKMSAAMLIMVSVAKLISGMSYEDMDKASKGILGFVGIVALLSMIASIPSKNIGKLGSMMLKISGALLIMVGISKIIAGMEWKDMGKAAIGISGLIGIIAALTYITKLAGGKLLGDIGSTLIKMAGAMLILTFVARMLVGMEWKDMGKATVGLMGLAGVVGMLIWITKLAGKDTPKITGTLLGISVAIGILAAVAVMLSLIDIDGLAKGVIAVGLLSAFVSGMILATKNAKDVKGNLIAISIAIGAMALAVAALSFIDPAKLAGATVALSMLMGAFSLIVKSTGTAQKVVGTLIITTIAVGLMAGILYLLKDLPVESTLAVAASLSMLLISLAVAMSIINKPSFVRPETLITVGILTLVVGALGGILYLLKDMPVDSTLTTAKSLSILLLALSGACLILSAVGMTGPAAFIGVGALMTLIVGVGTLMVAIGALADHFPRMEEFLNKGLPILEKIGYGLGSFFGNVISGFSEGLTAGLPGIATNLSNFMINLQPFIAGAKTIDETALTGVTSLVKMMALIAGASIVEKIASFASGGSSMESFVSQLSMFGDAIVSFSNKVKGNIDEASVLAAANAGKMLAEMQSMIAGTGGVVEFFVGKKNLGEFGAQLLAFGDAIVGFSQKVAGNIDESAVTAAASAGSLMAEMQAKIVPSGGVFQFFTGEKNMAEFGAQLVAFGNAIVAFSDIVGENIDGEAVISAAHAGTVMATLQDTIPGSDGVFQMFTGKQNLQTFGKNIKAFGEAITSFSQTVSGNVDGEAVVAAANAGRVMAELQKAIPEDNWFDGKVSLKDFGKDLTKFGEYIAEYSDHVSGIDTGAISTSLSATKKFVTLVNSMAGMDTSGVGPFKVALNNLKNANIDEFAEKADGSSVGDAISSVKKIINLIKSMSGLDTSGVGSFKKALKDLGDTNLNDFAKSFKGSTKNLTSIGSDMVNSIIKGIKSKQSSLKSVAKSLVNALINTAKSGNSAFAQAGTSLMNAFVKAIATQKGKVGSAAKSSISSAVNSMRSYYGSFYSAGSYLASGFAAGISANSYMAKAKASAMASAAAKAAKKALDINSPSRVFYGIGDYAGQGFVNALNDYRGISYNAGSSMADSARKGLSNAINKITDVINSDMDTQPTIRPVLDLSDIKSGAGTINGMFGMRPSVGALANINAINTMMNNQNGTNDDVVAAINKLGKTLGNVGGTTNVINGVTYDDGSNITDAVETLIRAAKMERRV